MGSIMMSGLTFWESLSEGVGFKTGLALDREELLALLGDRFRVGHPALRHRLNGGDVGDHSVEIEVVQGGRILGDVHDGQRIERRLRRAG